jgi:hypothetical protein
MFVFTQKQQNFAKREYKIFYPKPRMKRVCCKDSLTKLTLLQQTAIISLNSVKLLSLSHTAHFTFFNERSD